MCAMNRIAIPALTLTLLASLVAAQPSGGRPHWVGTWMTSVIGRPPYPASPATTTQSTGSGQPPTTTAPPAAVRMIFPSNQTLREIVHTTLGGDRARVTFTNAFGTAPLSVGAAHIALRSKDAAIVPGSDRALTVSGMSAFTIPAG